MINLNYIYKIKKNWKNYLIIFLIVLFLGNFLLNSNNNFKTNNIFPQTENLISSKLITSNPIYITNDLGFNSQEKNRKVIKNANLNLKTSDYDKSYAQIKNSINSYDALILSESTYRNSNNDRTTNLNLKVESSKLNTIINEIKVFGEITNLNIYSNDVTKSYSNYNNRSIRYQNQMNKYELMLNSKNLSINEEMQIQQRIDNLENLIFNLENNKLNIDENSKYSTLTISLVEKPSILNEINFLGFKDFIKTFLNSLNDALIFILKILGFLIPIGFIYLIYRLSKKYI